MTKPFCERRRESRPTERAGRRSPTTRPYVRCFQRTDVPRRCFLDDKKKIRQFFVLKKKILRSYQVHIYNISTSIGRIFSFCRPPAIWVFRLLLFFFFVTRTPNSTGIVRIIIKKNITCIAGTIIKRFYVPYTCTRILEFRP